MFRDAHTITKRVVQWGPDAEPVELPHSAVVLSEQELLQAAVAPACTPGPGDWTIYTTRPPSVEQRFGQRLAQAAAVSLNGPSDTCWIESLDRGWLFLIPNGPETGWLLNVGAPELLGESKLITKHISELGSISATFSAYPRLMQPLQGDGWLACGSAAMAFDPICGDGTANAVREAILACAVIRTGPEALDHYQARLTAGFQRHLALCLSYYQSGGSSSWWQGEAAALEVGLARNRPQGPFRYRLNGFELERVPG
jgi:hypothetical protein